MGSECILQLILVIRDCCINRKSRFVKILEIEIQEGIVMFRPLQRGLILLFAITTLSTGCLLNQYDSDPLYRSKQLYNQSEDLRQARDEWHRFWMNDHPSTLTYDRLTGTVGP